MSAVENIDKTWWWSDSDEEGWLLGSNWLTRLIQGTASFQTIPTSTRDPVSRVARVARAVEWALGVGAVGVWVAVVSERQMRVGQLIKVALVDVYESGNRVIASQWK